MLKEWASKERVSWDGPSAQAQRITRLCAEAAFGIALLAEAGWLLDARFLAGQWGGYIPMSPSTALAFLLLSSGVFSHARWSAHRLSRGFALAAAGLPALLGLLVLASFFAGVDSEVEWLLSRTNELVGPVPLGRMSPLTAAALLAESAALLLLLRVTRWRFAASMAALFAVLGMAVGLVFLVGYVYGAPVLYGGTTIPIALPTALAVLLVGTGQIRLAARGVRALRAWTRDTLRGLLLRAFLPGVLLIIFLDGWLDSMSWTYSVMNRALWDTLEVMVFCAVVVALTVWTARRTGDAIERAQEALRENEQRLASIYNTVGDVIFHLAVEPGGQFRFVSVNAAFLKVTGLSLERVVGKTVNEVIPEPSLTLVLGKYRQAVEEKTIVRWEETSDYPGGRLTGAVSVAPVFDNKGTCTHLVGSVHDITERKQAEVTLRESEERHRTILHTAMDGFWVLDTQGRLLEVNESYCRMSGYSAEELLAMRISDLEAEKTASETAEHIQKIVAQGEDRFESRHRRKDGSIFDVEVSVQYKPAEGGRLVIFLHDMSERRQAEEERNSLQLRLAQAQKMESVGRLAGGIAHDFGNLMSVIVLQADSALEELRSGDPLKEPLTDIRMAAETAVALTQQLLAFGRKQVLQPTVLDLNSVIATSQTMLRRLIGENIHLEILLGSGLALVKTDPSQLERIIMNLALNSRDAMPQGGKLTIETDSVELDESYVRLNPGAQPGSYVMLAVRDTGFGMNQETQDRLFDPFFTTKEVRKGTGLGLSSVYGIVKQSNGYVTVQSEQGRGTEFKIYLPNVLQNPEPVLASEAAPEQCGVETILVAEDEPALREKVCEILKGAGYQVLFGKDVDEVIEVAMEYNGPLDLLLTDVVMPDLSGPQLAHYLQRLFPQMKVLYMSGYPGPRQPNSALASEVDFIQKPFTKENLLRRLREVLEGRNSRIEQATTKRPCGAPK